MQKLLEDATNKLNLLKDKDLNDERKADDELEDLEIYFDGKLQLLCLMLFQRRNLYYRGFKISEIEATAFIIEVSLW